MRFDAGFVGFLVLALWAGSAGAQEAAPGTVTFLPSQYDTASPHLVKLIPDENATEKQFIRQDAKATWAVQCTVDGRELRPGRVYRLYAVARVKLNSPDARGPTFGVGVFDYTRWVVLMGARVWQTSEVKPGEWQTFDCGAWVPAPHKQNIWVGTERAALDHVDTDRFYIVPEHNAALEAVERRLAEQPGRLALAAQGGSHGFAAVEIADARNLALDLVASGLWDENLWPDAWAGLVVSYHTPAGYTKRADLAWGPKWRGRPELTDAPVELEPDSRSSASLADEIPRNEWVSIASPLESQAPADWDGRAWVGVLVRGMGSDQATLAAVFSSKPWSELGVWSTHVHDKASCGMDYAGLFGATPAALTANAAATRREYLERIVAQAAGGTAPPCILRTEAPQYHVFPDRVRTDWLESHAAVQPVALSLARREYESAQIVITPTGSNTLRQVRVEASALKGPNGSVIPSGDVSLRRVSHVEIRKPALGQEPGWWPDPLLPNAPFDVPAGENRAVWFTVRTRPETPPGTYTGNLTVSPDNASGGEIPVTVTVWPFELPLRNHLKTDFWFSFEQAGHFYGRHDGLPRDLEFRLIDFCNAYRIGCDFMTPSSVNGKGPAYRMFREADGSLTFDFSRLDSLLERAFAGGQNTFNIALSCWAQSPIGGPTRRDTGEVEPRPGGYDDPRFWEIYESFILAISRHMKEKGWWEFMHYQGWDEPQENRGDFEVLKKIYTFVHEQVPDLPRMITCGPVSVLYGAIDIWCPLGVYFRPEDIEARRAVGEQAWWYVIGHRFAPSLPLMEARMLPWTTWKYDLGGLLYWRSNHWCAERPDGSWFNVGTDPASRFPNVPWHMLADSGTLFYPGPEDGEPIASTRLEAIRDGLEDYEYLWLLRERLSARRAADREPAWAAEADALLAIPDEIAPDKDRNLQDWSRLQELRRRIAEMIIDAAG